MAKNVGRRLAEHMLESRSPLYRWLRAHYTQIQPIIAVRPAWQALAKTYAENNLPADARVPSRQAVRKTWFRLVHDIETEDAVKRTGLPSDRAAVAAGRAVPQPSPSPADDIGHADEVPARHRFVPAKLR